MIITHIYFFNYSNYNHKVTILDRIKSHETKHYYHKL